MASANGKPMGSETGRESFLALVLVTLGGGALGIFLILATGGYLAWLPVIAAGIAGFGLLHYWLWGRSFLRTIQSERDALLSEEQPEEYDSGHPPWERRF